MYLDMVFHAFSTVTKEQTCAVRLSRPLGMDQTRTSAYHPQGNGQVERMLGAMSAKNVKDNQRDWDTCLQKVLFAFHISPHETTGFTLVFGRTPIDVMLGRVEGEEVQGYSP